MNGNVTATGGKSFTYNSQNQLISMNSGAVQIVYDGEGSRVAKTVSGVTTYYLVDDLNPTGYAQVFEELTGSTVSPGAPGLLRDLGGHSSQSSGLRISYPSGPAPRPKVVEMCAGREGVVPRSSRLLR
jgi:hypothetical protein